MAGGVIKPWVSQASNAVGNAGQTASFKSASAFMAPGGGDNGLAALAKGLGALGGSMFELGIKDRRTARELALIQDVKNLQRESDEFLFDFMANNQGENALNASQAAEGFYQEKIAALNNKWGPDDVEAQTYLAMHAEPIALSGLRAMRGYGHESLNAWETSVIQGDVADLTRVASTPGNSPGQILDYFYSSGMGQRLDTHLQRSGLDPKASLWKAEQTLNAALETNLTSRLDEVIAENDGEEFVRIMSGYADGDTGGYAALGRRFLNPAKQIEYWGKWNRAQAAQAKAQAAELKLWGDEAQRQIIDMSYGVDGRSLTEDEVVARRDLLSPAEYEKYLKMSREGTTPPANSNPQTVIELTSMAVNGDADLQATADDALKSGLITVADYRAALNEGQQFRDPVIKMALEEIRLKTGYSEMNPDAAGSYIQAKQNFLSWLDSPAGEKASADDKVKMGSRIANNYRIVQAETLLSVPVPLMLVGSRTRPDLAATARSTQAAYDRQEISQGQYDEEVSRIRRMKQILDREQAEMAQDAKSRSSR